MTFENEFSSIASMEIFEDDELGESIRSIDQKFSNLNFEDEPIEFEQFNSEVDLDSRYESVISIDGSISPPINKDKNPVTYRVVRIVAVEFDPSNLPDIRMSETYNLDELRGWVDNVQSVNIPFVDFEKPEEYPPFETFVKEFISQIELYNTSFGDLMEECMSLNIRNNGSVSAVCSSCMEQNKMNELSMKCTNCGSVLDKYSPLRFYNGYQTAEFMTLFENLFLIDILRESDDVLVMKDGPMSQSRAPSAFIKRTFQNVYDTSSGNETIGIEKTGVFQSELLDIDSEDVPAPSVAPIPDDLLNSIRSSASDSIYGERTHFGKRFFICPDTDMRFTVYVPRLDRHEVDSLRYEIEDYEESLKVAFSAVDTFKSKMYRNSFIPLIIANEHASLREDAPYEMWISDELSN